MACGGGRGLGPHECEPTCSFRCAALGSSHNLQWSSCSRQRRHPSRRRQLRRRLHHPNRPNSRWQRLRHRLRRRPRSRLNSLLLLSAPAVALRRRWPTMSSRGPPLVPAASAPPAGPPADATTCAPSAPARTSEREQPARGASAALQQTQQAANQPHQSLGRPHSRGHPCMPLSRPAGQAATLCGSLARPMYPYPLTIKPSY